jgi:hypothetical protein
MGICGRKEKIAEKEKDNYVLCRRLENEKTFFQKTFLIFTRPQNPSPEREQEVARALTGRFEGDFHSIPPAKGGGQKQKPTHSRDSASYSSFPTHPL